MNKPPILCDRCNSNFSCLLDYDGENCRKTRSVEPTNADRLNAMSIEEKAKWIAHIAGCPLNIFEESPLGRCITNCKARDCWLEWLQQEVKE